MADNLYPAASRQLNEARQAFAPETNDAFAAFSKSVFKEGALAAKTKQLIAVAAAHHPVPVLHPWAHPQRAARRRDARRVMEAIWVAAEMRAGAAFAHSTLALDAMNEVGG